jgi:hypothetical protein
MNRAQRTVWRLIHNAERSYASGLESLEECLSVNFDSGRRHPIGIELAAAIDATPRLTISARDWWRGRVDADESSPPSSFSAPPPALAKAGRFNRAGESFWYLADTPQHVVMEIGDDWRPAAVVQRFRVEELRRVLNLARRDLIDTAETRLSPIVMALIFGRWLGQIGDPHSAAPKGSEYLLSQFVAECARRAGFAAILSSGARTGYVNLQFPALSVVDISSVGKPRHIDLGCHMSATTERVMLYA